MSRARYLYGWLITLALNLPMAVASANNVFEDDDQYAGGDIVYMPSDTNNTKEPEPLA